MTKLQDLYRQCGQSPWLDNLRRDWLHDGTLQGYVDRGIRGVTSNPSIFQKAMTAGNAYDDQLRSLVEGGSSTEDASGTMPRADIRAALGILRPVFDECDGNDGFVSLEVAASLAHDPVTTTADAIRFHDTIAEPNLMVKIPATAE